MPEWFLNYTISRFIFALLQIIYAKHLFYNLLGLILGLESLSGSDEFWLYDWPISPIAVPSFIIIDRPKMSPEKVLDSILTSQRDNNVCNVKLRKVLGKYYFEKMTEDEY